MTTALANIFLELKSFAEPLLEMLDGPEQLECLFYRYGWKVSLDDAASNKLDQGLALRPALDQFFRVAEATERKLSETPNSRLSAQDVAALVQSGASLLAALANLSLPNPSDLSQPLSDPAFWASIGEHLLDDLLEEYLRIYHPNIFLVLHFGGAIRYEPMQPDGPFRTGYNRTVFDWHQLLTLTRDPLAALKQTYKWNHPTAPFEYQRLVEALGKVLRAIHVPVRTLVSSLQAGLDMPPDSGYHIQKDLDALSANLLYGFALQDRLIYEIGLECFPATADGELVPSGVMLRPILRGGAQGELPLGNSFSLRWKIAATAEAVIGVVILPQKIGLVQGPVSAGASLDIAGTRKDPWYLFGNAQSARMEIYNPSVRLSIEDSVADPEAKLHLNAGTAGQPGCKIVLPMDEADGFVKSTVGESPIAISLSAEAIWSSKSGLSFNGKANLDLDLPVNISVGPVQVQHLLVRLTPKGDGENTILAGELSAGLGLRIGPILASVDRLGFELTLDFAAQQKNLGFVDLSLGFKPPSAVGLAIDAAGVSGGGFLGHDPVKHEYSGMLQLEFIDLAIQAFGLITTQVEGGPGYSLIALVDANFPPVQLGWGFTLNGVGGLLGVNRTASTDALRAALKADTLSTILFPKDAIANAPQLLGQLDTLFPAAHGRFLFGPMAEIGWGTPTLLTISLALILELPPPIRLVLLARLALQLPSPSNALVRINMDALGILDLGKSEFSLDATLYDSHLLAFTLTGDMALRANWGTQREFLLSVGGFHPRFAPPAGFPTLKRMTIQMASGSIATLRLESYFAVTSNTLQFGSSLFAHIGVSGFGLDGHFSFDALLQVDPFHFVADISGSVALSAGGENLMSVGLDATLSGPAPWSIAGNFKFSILFWDVNVSFSETWGEAAQTQQLESVDVVHLLTTALAEPNNWSAQLPDGVPALVSARNRDDGVMLTHPLARLEVHERVVPLGVDITHFGAATPSGAKRFEITGVSIGLSPPGEQHATVAYQSIQDDFAPAQFLDLSDEEKLRRPSFERHDAGVRFEGTKVLLSDRGAVSKELIYQSFHIDTPNGEILGETRAPIAIKRTAATIAGGAANRAEIQRAGRRKYNFGRGGVIVAEPAFVIVNASNLAVANIGSSGETAYSHVRAALDEELARNPQRRGQLEIVALHELGAA